MSKIKKLSNLEAYYLEYCEEFDGVYRINKPFSELSNIEKHVLETSQGFKDFLIRGIWTKAAMYFILGVIVVSILLAVATHYQLFE